MSLLRPRQRPCPSCPYRRNCPSGVWAPEEYAKLPPYDLETWAQPTRMFMCHTAPGLICSGWAGCHDMGHSLSVRLALVTDRVDPGILVYTTAVPLWSSGAEAAAWGMRDIEHPGPDAWAKIRSFTQLHRRPHS